LKRKVPKNLGRAFKGKNNTTLDAAMHFVRECICKRGLESPRRINHARLDRKSAIPGIWSAEEQTREIFTGPRRPVNKRRIAWRKKRLEARRRDSIVSCIHRGNE